MTAALFRRSLAAMPLVAPRAAMSFAAMSFAAMTLAAFAARLAAAARTVASMLALAVLARALAVFGLGVNFVVALGARNLLADQLLDRGHRLGIERGDDGDRSPGAAGAAGAADAVNVVVGMMRHIEIEDVTDHGNIEAAGSDVGGDQHRNLTLAKLVEGRG